MSILYVCVPNTFCFTLRLSLGGRSAETYEGCSNLSISNRLGSFLLFFWAGQGVADIRFAWNKYNATCSRVSDALSDLLCDLGRQGGVLKFMKNDRF